MTDTPAEAPVGETVLGWIKEWWAHVQTHWQDHILPAAVCFAAYIVLPNVCILGGAGGAFTWAILMGEVDETAAALGAGSIFLLTLSLMLLALLPLQYGYTRFTLGLMRGQTPEWTEILWGFRRFVPLLVLVTIVQGLVLLGTLLCILPGILLGFLLSFTTPAFAERDRGAIDALSAGWAVAKANWLPLLVFHLVLTGLVLVAAFIPVVGIAITVPLANTMITTAWVAACRRTPDAVPA